MKPATSIGKGKFEASKSDIEKLLTELGLLEDRTYLQSYPLYMPATVRSMKYGVMWRHCIDHKLYDFRLVDHSLIQLTADPDASYSFLEAPLAAMTFEEFAHSTFGVDWRELEHDLREAYEEYLSSSVDDKPATPVRYDYSEPTYREGVHPAGHLHFGLDNQIRICTRRSMSPISFVLFVIRQFYPRQWELLLTKPAWKHLYREIRDSAVEVAPAFFKGNDLHELHLN